MSGSTSIEWTDATWNPVVGCSVYSPGCKNCYAMRQAHRLASNPATPHYHGTTQITKAGPVFTGKVAQAPERVLLAPLRWWEPRRVFVNSMGDLFHEAIPDAWIDQVFAVMALCPDHTFQVLTKRGERMREYVCRLKPNDKPVRRFQYLFEEEEMWRLVAERGAAAVLNIIARSVCKFRWPLPNVWLGVSAERQEEADQRIPLLLQTPAAVRFVSAEPLLGPIKLDAIKAPRITPDDDGWTFNALTTGDYYSFVDDLSYNQSGDGPYRDHALDWVIVGGESGPHARPMHPDWARAIRDDCASSGVAFFFKQWGEWVPATRQHFFDGDALELLSGEKNGKRVYGARVGKKAAGRLLDGREHNGFPEGSVPQPTSPAPDTNKLAEADA